MRHANKAVPALVALVATLGLAACGSSDSGSSEAVSGEFELVPGASSDYQGLSGEAILTRTDGGTVASLAVTGLEPNTAYVAHLHSGGCAQADPGGPHFKFDPGGSEEPPNEIHLEFSSSAGGSGRAEASSNREVPAGEAGSIVLHQAKSGHTTAAAAADEAETVLVHGGHHHDEPSRPEKIACAELEGGGDTGALRPSDGPESAGMGGQVPTVVVRDGEPVGGIAELEYDAGDQIRFEVESDVADEVHVHGYDLMEDVRAGGTVSFDFPAEIEGIFEVELEGRKQQIAELRVNP